MKIRACMFVTLSLLQKKEKKKYKFIPMVQNVFNFKTGKKKMPGNSVKSPANSMKNFTI